MTLLFEWNKIGSQKHKTGKVIYTMVNLRYPIIGITIDVISTAFKSKE